MTQLANDRIGAARPSRSVGGGLLLAVISATSFGMSGPLARGLLSIGWSPGAIVLARIGIAAVAVAPFSVVALRGRWRQLRAKTGQLLMYGVLATAGAQFCYFSAVATMDVAPALLIEYTAPATVVLWLWARRGERPSPLTLAGAGVAAVGLILVLDLFSGADLAWSGVAWSLGAMVGAATYFIISAETDDALPPVTLAGGGLLIGSLTLAILGGVGLLPMHAGLRPVTYSIGTMPWWGPLLILGLVTAAVAYVAGVAAGRRLGSRVASFVSLLEVVAAVLFAWLLVSQLPGLPQLIGGLLIIGGVVLVRLAGTAEPLPETAARPSESL
jgi:drug/metabolite transporter (DMT)-like permease